MRKTPSGVTDRGVSSAGGERGANLRSITLARKTRETRSRVFGRDAPRGRPGARSGRSRAGKTSEGHALMRGTAAIARFASRGSSCAATRAGAGADA